MLVPVRLQRENHPTRKETVNVLLDPQPDDCFLYSVLQRMGLSGEEVTLEVNTISGRTFSKSQVIRGLSVEDHEENRVASDVFQGRHPS